LVLLNFGKSFVVLFLFISYIHHRIMPKQKKSIERISYAKLQRRFKDKPVQPQSLNLRLYRAASWLKSAQHYEKDPDIAYISLWIAFNACYAIDDNEEIPLSEKERFRSFIAKLVEHDEQNRIFNIIWEKFSQSIRVMLENPYVFKPFWDYQRSKTTSWKAKLAHSIREANVHLSNRNVPGVLEILLDRLYVLRNQIVHGGSTYGSSVNRGSVKDGGRILQFLVPVIVDIMSQNPSADWGETHFPVVRD
jgi:hypothetical protein